MQESWKQVTNLIDELKPLLLRSGVPLRQVTLPDADPNVIPLAKYNEIFDWLHKLKLSDEWVAVMKVWTLIPASQWAGYDLHELTGLQEQILLERALAKLRKRWKLERPSFFGRKFRAKNDNGDSDCDEESADRERQESEDTAV